MVLRVSFYHVEAVYQKNGVTQRKRGEKNEKDKEKHLKGSLSP